MDSHVEYEPQSFDGNNPYAAPTADIGIMHAVNTDAEAIRRHYLKHEASVKSIGLLYMLPALMFFVLGIVLLIPILQGGGIVSLVTGALCIGMSFLFLIIAMEIRKLRRWCAIPIGILSGIGLLQIPIGTVINAYILWLVFSAKGRYVMSAEYQNVIAATPHIKYRTSVLVIVLAVILVVFLGLGALSVVIG